MRHTIWPLFIALAFLGCDRAAMSESTAPSRDKVVTSDNATKPDHAVTHDGPARSGDAVTRENEVRRDNTAVNERDRVEGTKTPLDQNENQADIDTTASIRKQVVATKMSINAQNVKIITQDGKVTLRGPVKNDDEKQKIEAIAHSVAGADKVDSQLEIEQ